MRVYINIVGPTVRHPATAATLLLQGPQRRRSSLPEWRDWGWDLNVLAPLQPLLTFNEVVHTVDH